jgi:hypothetical protein
MRRSTDDDLAEMWEATLNRPVTHEEHVRVARALVLRHGRVAARERLVSGTLRNCISMDTADRFDQDLTERWADLIADCVESSEAESFAAFAKEHPELLRSDLLGPPAWKRFPQS